MTEVSVCLLTYRQEDTLAQAIESVLCQRVDFDYEILIGDDASDDGTAQVAERFCRAHPERCFLIRQPENVGPVANAKTLIRRAKGRYLAFLEGDDYWTDPEKLALQVQFLRTHPDCSLVYHATRVVDETGETVRLLREKKPVDSLETLFPSGHFHMSTGSMVGINLYRKTPELMALFGQSRFVGDIPLKAAYLRAGSIGYLDRVMSVYRRVTTRGPSYSAMDVNVQRLDAVRAYRCVRRMYRGLGCRPVNRMQIRVLEDMFRSFDGDRKRYRELWKQLTALEKLLYISRKRREPPGV